MTATMSTQKPHPGAYWYKGPIYNFGQFNYIQSNWELLEISPTGTAYQTGSDVGIYEDDLQRMLQDGGKLIAISEPD